MQKIRLTKEFHFEMAHALWNYDGACKHIHGHSYKLFVTVIGNPINDADNPKNGMVIDFGILKKIVNTEIINNLDHALVINQAAFNSIENKENQMFEKIHLTTYQPTCENMIIDFAEKLQKTLPQGVELFSLKLHETATSYAEWFASDNC